MRNFRPLFMLRCIILCGQIGAVTAAGFWLAMPPPPAVLAVVLSILLLVNAAAWLWLEHTLSRLLFVPIVLDVLALSVLFYFTGGATNPLTWLLLLSITVAATALSKLQSWLVALTAIAAYSLLMVYHRTLPGVHLPSDPSFALHILGMWLGFILSAVLIAHLVAGMAAHIRARDAALARARERALRDERLVSLGSLAANTAHELGTPLNTMAILTEELELDLDAEELDAAFYKLAEIRAEIHCCKQSIAAIASSTRADAAYSGRAMQVAAFMQTTVNAWRARRGDVGLRYRYNRAAPNLRFVAEQSLTSVLVNVFDNAADASPDDIDIHADWSNALLYVRVDDRGQGIAPEVRARIGREPISAKRGGHGLGLYLAKGILDRFGGRLVVWARDGGGASVEVRLPLTRLRVE